jgi:phage head maturation protease
MRLYFPIAKVDAERREVWGYASTEARDEQGEIVKREALQAALGDYMKFANIREMHQMSAVGVAKEANIDDNGLYIGAKIIDPIAWQKVVEGVYKGFSIGGRITQRDPQDYKTITGLVLNEISVVDRPANPQAVFDYWKASSVAPAEPVLRSGFWVCGNPLHSHDVKSAAAACIRKAIWETQIAEPFNASFQIWTCGVSEHRHLAKADAQKCIGPQKEDASQAVTTPAVMAKGADEPGDGSNPYSDVAYADPGYQEDRNKRYPIDTEEHIRAAWSYINHPKNATRYSADNLKRVKNRIIRAWKKKIDKEGPPTADDNEKVAGNVVSKGWWDVEHVAHMILDLDWLQHQLETQAAMEGDDSPQPAKLKGITAELCAALTALPAPACAARHDHRLGRKPARAVPVERGSQCRRGQDPAGLLPDRLADRDAPAPGRRLCRRGSGCLCTFCDGRHHQRRERISVEAKLGDVIGAARFPYNQTPKRSPAIDIRIEWRPSARCAKQSSNRTVVARMPPEGDFRSG